jgi:hypothetical protein
MALHRVVAPGIAESRLNRCEVVLQVDGEVSQLEEMRDSRLAQPFSQGAAVSTPNVLLANESSRAEKRERGCYDVSSPKSGGNSWGGQNRSCVWRFGHRRVE